MTLFQIKIALFQKFDFHTINCKYTLKAKQIRKKLCDNRHQFDKVVLKSGEA